MDAPFLRRTSDGLSAVSIASAALETLRPYQWLKNCLVFVPLLAVHRLAELGLLGRAVQAFVAFSLTASAVYVMNDLHDAAADSQHPHKRSRPIPSGRLPRALAGLLIPLLLSVGLGIAAVVDVRLAGVLALYFVIMCGYTWTLKQVALLDAIVLGAGYAMRVFAGSMAVDIAPSPHLLAFCIFLFFSLALLKRYAELALLRTRDGSAAHARSYGVEDQPPLLAIGTASGVMSVLILVLYVSPASTTGIVPRSDLVWATCVLLLYWISHLWLAACRGRMTDDPLVFAVRDRISLALILLMGITTWFAL